MVGLSAAALVELARVRESFVVPGGVYWVPGSVVIYGDSGKERPCLVAAVDAARAHMIPGTSRTATGKALIVEAGEIDLIKRTHFDFRSTFPVSLCDLIEFRHAGTLAPVRIAEMKCIISEFGPVALKRLMSS